MILTGQMDSPFVRRVAVALHHYGLPFSRNVISVYDDFAEILKLNPLGKVPALTVDDGTVLAESHLILDYLDRLVGPDAALMPADPEAQARLIPHLATAVGVAEKAVEFRTETVRRPSAIRDPARVERITAQIGAALDWLEDRTPPDCFIGGDALTHADIASAVAITFIERKNPEHFGGDDAFPRLRAHMMRCEALPPFRAAPFAEG